MATPITLKVFRGSELVRSEQFNREIIKIGRLASAHLCLEDDKISRIHSVIEVAPDGAISIIDMGSAEGTFVNGKKVSRGTLRVGDQITLGGLRIVVESDAAPVSEVQNHAVAAPVQPAPAPAPRTNGKVAHAVDGKPAVVAAVAAAPAPAPIAAPVAAAAPAPAVAKAPAAAPRRRTLQPAAPLIEDLSSEGDLGIELRVLWGDT